MSISMENAKNVAAIYTKSIDKYFICVIIITVMITVIELIKLN